MQTLFKRATEYARGLGYGIVVIEGPAEDRYTRVSAGSITYLVLDSGTAYGQNCGEVVFRACESMRSSMVVRPTPARLLASS